MFKRREGFFNGYDNTKIFFQVWEKDQSQGTIIINHGHGEHSDSYVRVVEALKNENWSIFASDFRGHGRSDGKRGYARSFQEYCDDYYIFIQKIINDWQPHTPTVLLGHSTGALVQLKTLIDHPEINIKAQVCSCPLLGLAVPVPGWKSKAAELLNQYLPSITMWNELTNDMLTRDADVIREFEQDVLRHNRMSSGVYLGILEATQEVLNRAQEVKVPTLFQLSEEDPVISTPQARLVFEKLGSKDKKILVYGDGARHEIYNDIGREVPLGDLLEYLRSVLRGAA